MAHPSNTFHVSFDTKSQPGTVVAVEVTIRNWTMRANDIAKLDLCDHPLYPALHRYCLDNAPTSGPAGFDDEQTRRAK